MMRAKPLNNPPWQLTSFGIWLWLRVPIWVHWYSYFGMEGQFGLFNRKGYCFCGVRFDAYTTYWPHMKKWAGPWRKNYRIFNKIGFTRFT